MRRYMPLSFARPYLIRKPVKALEWQFHIRRGEHPKIHLYVASDFQYESAEQAKNAADRYLISRGIDPMRCVVYTISKRMRKQQSIKESNEQQRAA